MRLGAENREQVYLLVGLAMVAGYMVYISWRPGRPAAPSGPAAAPTPGQPGGGRRARHQVGESKPFRPMVPEHVDGNVDPVPRLDLLGGLAVPDAAGHRNLFDFRQEVRNPPAGKPASSSAGSTGTQATQDPVHVLPASLNFTYYGWAAHTGSLRRKAFFLDGADLIIRVEGETVRDNYRVVRIGTGSVTVENTADGSWKTLFVPGAAL